MCRKTESWRQVCLCPSKANAQLLSMWCIVHFSALHNGHAALVVSPHNFNKFGVINQLTDAFKPNLTNDLLTFPQIRFFHERSKGNAVSDHFSQMPWVESVNEWLIIFDSWKFFAFKVTNFLFSATEGFGLKFPKPIPCIDDCVGNFISRLTSAFITEETFVALHTLFSLEFWDALEKYNFLTEGSIEFSRSSHLMSCIVS